MIELIEVLFQPVSICLFLFIFFFCRAGTDLRFVRNKFDMRYWRPPPPEIILSVSQHRPLLENLSIYSAKIVDYNHQLLFNELFNKFVR